MPRIQSWGNVSFSIYIICISDHMFLGLLNSFTYLFEYLPVLTGVTDQRRQLKAKLDGRPSMMTDERKEKLDALGFLWKVRERADWNDRYEQLLEYKKENGHCVVPQVNREFLCVFCDLCTCRVFILKLMLMNLTNSNSTTKKIEPWGNGWPSKFLSRLLNCCSTQ